MYDDRDERSFSSLQNDIFLATRLAFNDTQSTEILFGGIFDREHSSKLFSLEGSRRIGNSYKATIEARIFEDIDNEEFLFFIREDSFLQFTIAKYFYPVFKIINCTYFHPSFLLLDSKHQLL